MIIAIIIMAIFTTVMTFVKPRPNDRNRSHCWRNMDVAPVWLPCSVLRRVGFWCIKLENDQTGAPNNVTICCVEMLRSFGRGFMHWVRLKTFSDILCLFFWKRTESDFLDFALSCLEQRLVIEPNSRMAQEIECSTLCYKRKESWQGQNTIKLMSDWKKNPAAKTSNLLTFQ